MFRLLFQQMHHQYFASMAMLVIVVLTTINDTYAQSRQVKTFKGQYKQGIINYSYYEDVNGNIVLHGLYEYTYIYKELDKEGKYDFDRHVSYKGSFKDGKKDNNWVYTFPVFETNESSARGGGNAEVNITIDRDRVTESSYGAKNYIPGDHYSVKTGQLVVNASYSNGKLNNIFKSITSTKTAEYEKLAGKLPKFIKNKYNDRIESLLNFKDGKPTGTASTKLNGSTILIGEFNSAGEFDGLWQYSPSKELINDNSTYEGIKFNNGFIVSALQVNVNKNDTLINISNDNIIALLKNFDNSTELERGYKIGNKFRIDDEISTKQLPQLNEVPISKFQKFNNQLLELIADVYLVANLDIEFYNNKIETVDYLNFNNFIITDESKLTRILGDPLEKLFREHLKALGGEAAIKNITSYRVDKTIIKSKNRDNYDSKDIVFETKGIVKYKNPDKYFLSVPDCFNFFSSIYYWNNGNKSYLQYDYKPLRITSPLDNDFFIFKTMIVPLYQMKQKGYKFEIPREQFDKNATLIKATSPNGLVIDVFVDKTTYLISGYNIYVTSSTIDNHNYLAFQDIKNNYKVYNGVLLPWVEVNNKFNYQFEYQLNPPISNSDFESEYQQNPNRR